MGCLPPLASPRLLWSSPRPASLLLDEMRMKARNTISSVLDKTLHSISRMFHAMRANRANQTPFILGTASKSNAGNIPFSQLISFRLTRSHGQITPGHIVKTPLNLTLPESICSVAFTASVIGKVSTMHLTPWILANSIASSESRA
jgi:hypothetical protein